MLPRLPQPLLEQLRALASWQDVLSLTSIDKREAPSRRFWIECASVARLGVAVTLVEQRSFVSRFPRCPVWQVVAYVRQICPTAMRLTFFSHFNEPLDERVVLPARLTDLAFGDRFDRPVHCLRLPATLKRLTFGASFNQSLDQCQLPRGLEQLTLGAAFSQALPASLSSVLVIRSSR